MPKCVVRIGYAESHEVQDPEHPSVWVEDIIERMYRGDMYETTKRSDRSDQVIDGISINSTVSVVADEYAYGNFSKIKYVKFMGVCWKAETVKVQRPRLLINIGGVYHGRTADT